MTARKTDLPPPSQEELDFVAQRYQVCLEYYWKVSRTNKRWYKGSHFATIILGSLVTLIASLSSATFLKESNWTVTFQIMTPLFAAVLTIVNAVSQTFQWGAAWRDMVINAQRMEGELDRIKVTPDQKRNPEAELKLLNDLIQNESQEFFSRIVGRGSTVPKTAKS